MDKKFYTYKGNKYRVLHESKMKTDNGWIDSIVYANETEVFVREKEDFYSKFEPCENNRNYVQDAIYYGVLALKDNTPLKNNTGDLSYARYVLNMHDIPAQLRFSIEHLIKRNKLFCDYEGNTYKVVGFSRLGDLWLTDNFNSDSYSLRVNIHNCENFRKKKIK